MLFPHLLNGLGVCGDRLTPSSISRNMIRANDGDSVLQGRKGELSQATWKLEGLEPFPRDSAFPEVKTGLYLFTHSLPIKLPTQSTEKSIPIRGSHSSVMGGIGLWPCSSHLGQKLLWLC